MPGAPYLRLELPHGRPPFLPIRKPAAQVAANMPSYERMRSGFSWRAARAALGGPGAEHLEYARGLHSAA